MLALPSHGCCFPHLELTSWVSLGLWHSGSFLIPFPRHPVHYPADVKAHIWAGSAWPQFCSSCICTNLVAPVSKQPWRRKLEEQKMVLFKGVLRVITFTGWHRFCTSNSRSWPKSLMSLVCFFFPPMCLSLSR